MISVRSIRIVGIVHAIRPAALFGRQSKLVIFLVVLLIVRAVLIGSTGWKAFLGNVFPVPTGPVAEFAHPGFAPSSGAIIAVTAFETDGSAQKSFHSTKQHIYHVNPQRYTPA